jgi:hypothetical protein
MTKGRVALLIAAAYLVGCSKQSAIVGTWLGDDEPVQVSFAADGSLAWLNPNAAAMARTLSGKWSALPDGRYMVQLNVPMAGTMAITGELQRGKLALGQNPTKYFHKQ